MTNIQDHKFKNSKPTDAGLNSVAQPSLSTHLRPCKL